MGYVPPTTPRPYLLRDDEIDVESTRKYLGDGIDAMIDARLDNSPADWSPPYTDSLGRVLIPIVGLLIAGVGVVATLMIALS